MKENFQESFKSNDLAKCKLCGSERLTVFMHTAKCNNCGALMYYPYPENHSLETDEKIESISKYKKSWFSWYQRAARLNHLNFTNMFLFSIENLENTFSEPIKILDYGGGGGQFAFVCKSLLPLSEVFIVDINDHALLDEYRVLNKQIKWKEFQKNNTTFDYIFLNDVFEHVNDPLHTLDMLSKKLSKNGKIFIDTPKQFWLYPFLRFIYKPLYSKLLKGTVTLAHLQLWTKKSLFHVVDKAGLKVKKYVELNEFTMKPEFYLAKMGITNKIILFIGKLFYKNAKKIASNKIQCILVKK